MFKLGWAKFNIVLALMLVFVFAFPVGFGYINNLTECVTQSNINDLIGKTVGEGIPVDNSQSFETKAAQKLYSEIKEVNKIQYEYAHYDDGNDYYLIRSAEQLNGIRNFIDIDKFSTTDRTTAEVKRFNFKLVEDIDLSKYNNGKWSPIYKIISFSDGNASAQNEIFGFSGIFDGNGHTISNMKIENDTTKEDAMTDIIDRDYTGYKYNIPTKWMKAFNNDSIKAQWEVYAGLFAKIHGGTVKNLHLASPKINLNYHGSRYVTGGSVWGSVFYDIRDQDFFVGCLAGVVETGYRNENAVKSAGLNINKSTTITNVYVTDPTINVKYTHKVSQSYGYMMVGGLIGKNYMDTNISSCFVRGGNIKAEGYASSSDDKYTSPYDSDYSFEHPYHSAGVKVCVGGLVGTHGMNSLGRSWHSDRALPCSLTVMSCYSTAQLMAQLGHEESITSSGGRYPSRVGTWCGGILGSVKNISGLDTDNGATISKCFAIIDGSASINQDVRTNDRYTSYENFQPICSGVDSNSGTLGITDCYYHYNDLSKTFSQSGTSKQEINWFSSDACYSFLR